MTDNRRLTNVAFLDVAAISAMYIWLPLVLYAIVFILFTFFFDRDGRLAVRGDLKTKS